MTGATRIRPLLALGVLSLIWGYNWVVMKEALRYIDPFAFSALRSVLGAFALFAILVLLDRSRSPGSFSGVLILGLVQTTLFVTFSAWALVSGGAGKTAVLVYTMPLWLLMLAWPILGERVRGWQWLALLCAFAGLLLILEPWRLQTPLFSAMLALLAAICWAVSGVWVKRLRASVRIDLLPLTAWQLLLGCIPLLIFAFVARPQPITWAPTLIGALLYNAIPATALAWLLWLYALHELPAGMAGMGTLLAPLVGVSTAWLQLGERPGPTEAGGMILVFTGLTILVADRWRSR
ncbi:MAG: DMT family transporter [Acidobacteriota bacterium]